MTHGVLGHLQHHVRVRLDKDVAAHFGDGFGDKHALQGHAMLECAEVDGGQLAARLEVHIFHGAALIECIGIQRSDAGGNGNARQAPAMAESAPADGLQGGIFRKPDVLQIAVAEEGKAADLRDPAPDLQRRDLVHIVLDDPGGIDTVGGIVLDRARSVHLQGAVGKQDILDVRSREAGVHNVLVVGGNKRAFLIEMAHIAQQVHLAGNRAAIFVIEVHIRINVHLADGHHACGKVSVGLNGAVVVEAVQLGPAGAHAVLAEVVVVTVDLLQAGQGHAVHIVGLAVPALQQDAVGIALAVQLAGEQLAADGALHHAVRQLIAVAGGGNGGAPLHHGAAHLAVGAAGVAVLGAGGRLVGQGLGGMGVAAVPGGLVILTLLRLDHELLNGPCLGIAENILAGKRFGPAVCKGHKPLLHADLHGHPPVFVIVLEPAVGILVALFKDLIGAADPAADVVQLPDADGDGDQSLLALEVGLAGPGNGQGQDLIRLLIVIGHLKALGHHHVIKLPLVHAVQIQRGGHGLNIGNIVRHHIHIVERTEENAVQGRIVGDHPDLGRLAAGDRGVPDQGGVVALLVADGELDGVLTRSQGHAVVDGDRSVAEGAGNRVAVDIGAGGRAVDTGGIGLPGIVRHCGGKVHRVIGNGRTIVQDGRIGHGGSRIGRTGEYRSLAIVHRRGVIQGDIIQIDREVAVDIGVFLCIVVVAGAVAVGDIELHGIVAVVPGQALILAQVAGDIVPAGLAEGVHHARSAGSSVHRVAGDGFFGHGVCAVLVDLSDGEQDPSYPEAHILVRDIDPCADGLDAGIIGHVTVSGRATVQSRHLIAGLLAVGVVNVDPQGIAAAADLAVFRRCHKGAALGQIIVILGIAGVESVGGAVLEVEDHLGPLAQLDLGGGGHVRSDDRCRDSAFGDAAVTGGEVKAVDGAHAGVAQGKAHVLGLDLHLVEAVGGRQVQRHRFPEGHGHAGVDEGQLLGHHPMDGDGAHVPALVPGRQDGVAHGHRGQDAVFIGTVGDGVGDALGDLRRRTGRRHAGHGDLRAGAGGDVLVRRRHAHAVEHVGGGRRGGDDQARGNGPLGAVGGPVDDADGVGALRPGGIGGGAAAVQVDSRHAAGLQHDLGQLVHGTAAGEGLLAAVQHHGHHLAVGGDAHAGAGVAVRVVRTACVGGNVLAVADQPHGTGHRLPDGALAVLVHILAEVAGIVDDRRLAVLQDGEEVVIAVGAEGHTVDIGDAHGLTGGHVVEGGVDACHYVVILADELGIIGVAVLPVGIGHLVGELLHAHDAVFVLLEIGRLHHHVVPGDVRSGHIVDHLLAVLGVGVVDVLLHAGGQGRLRVLEHIVGLGCIVRSGRKCRRRHHADKHQQAQNKGRRFLERKLFHAFFPFIIDRARIAGICILSD